MEDGVCNDERSIVADHCGCVACESTRSDAQLAGCRAADWHARVAHELHVEESIGRLGRQYKSQVRQHKIGQVEGRSPADLEGVAIAKQDGG